MRRSYHVHQQLLTDSPATEWLDQCVLYVASVEYDIGVLVIYTEGLGEWYCRHVGAGKSSYIVLYHACGHYEAVEYNGMRQFPSDHEFVVRLLQFAATTFPTTQLRTMRTWRIWRLWKELQGSHLHILSRWLRAMTNYRHSGRGRRRNESWATLNQRHC